MMLYSILIYLCLAIVCNSVYFFASQGNYPECGSISLIFVNVAILCQFLSLLTNRKRDEKIQKKGQQLISVGYLIGEIIVAAYFTIYNVSLPIAGTIQILMLGAFLIIYFGLARANLKTNQSISDLRSKRSVSLLDANDNLRSAIAECQNQEHKNLLREVYAELSIIPMTADKNLNQIDDEINAKVAMFCECPTTYLQTQLSRLINRRKTMLMVINQ